MHIGRVRKLASAQATCGPPRTGVGAAGAAGARAGTLPDGGSIRWLLLVCEVLSVELLVAAVGLALLAVLGSLAASAARLAAADAAS